MCEPFLLVPNVIIPHIQFFFLSKIVIAIIWLPGRKCLSLDLVMN